ncbi:MAG: choice-of-anchor tandem repeat GloVer-containing protein [Terracidiphilus sp.]
MQTTRLDRASALFACLAMLALIGCGSSSTSGGSTTYTLGGTLAGLSTGQSVSLQDNGGDTLTLSANGVFSFPMSLDAGSAYAVTVHSHTPGIACPVSNGSGTVGSSDVTEIAVSCAAGTEKILHSFGANATDGQYSYSSLIMDSSGNLYGTTENGGANGDGTVFKIDAAGTETVLYSFGASAADGLSPMAAPIMDSAGDLYGTTPYGGANDIISPGGDGTVFKIGATGTETILHSFGASANDGLNPNAGLIMDSTGNLYGTTVSGGAKFEGTAFEIGADGAETILYPFGAKAYDGQSPYAGLTMDSAGNLYGTTINGGASSFGTVFKIDTGGTETILHSFPASSTDGWAPHSGLIQDSAGNLYGTTDYGGTNNMGTEGYGTVYKISAAGTETVLYSFGASATDAQFPSAGLIMDSAGNLYGTTVWGGANGYGTVYKIDAAGTETVLYSFGASSTDGSLPNGSLIMDSAGNLYGTTDSGGAYGMGTVYVID